MPGLPTKYTPIATRISACSAPKISAYLGNCFGILHPGMESIPETKHVILEEVQRRDTTMIWGYTDLSYKERKKNYVLTRFERGRSRGDLIESYKIMTGKEPLQWERFCELAPNKATRDTSINELRKRKEH